MKTVVLDEAALVAEARRGSRDAAGELVARHWRTAWRVAYGMTGSREMAEDVAQDAFERAFRALERYDPRGSFAAWLHRIVVNRALDLLRGERGTVGLERVGPVAAPERPTADPELAAAIARLDADRRAVVALRYGLDYSLAQIAEVLSLPLGTVQSRLHRALAELRSLLEVDDAERS